MGEVIESEDNDDNVVYSNYYPDGKLKETYTNAHQQLKTTFTYDAKNRLISKATPLGETEHYTWDLLDRRTAIRNFNAAEYSIGYDAVGNIVHEIDALKNHVQHEYDPNGNRTRTIDAMGNSTVFAYDGLNRLVGRGAVKPPDHHD